MIYLISFLIPNIAYADFNSFMVNVYREIFNPTIRLLVVVAFAYFFYGVFVFLSNMDSEDKKTAGKNHMIWGIVGLTVMLGVWGIMSILINTFDIKGIKLNGGGGGSTVTSSSNSNSNSNSNTNTNTNTNTSSNSSNISNSQDSSQGPPVGGNSTYGYEYDLVDPEIEGLDNYTFDGM